MENDTILIRLIENFEDLQSHLDLDPMGIFISTMINVEETSMFDRVFTRQNNTSDGNFLWH